MRHRFSPRAFTLVELLVVIAIIGILVALLLPAVQMARESSRRSKCANNLKQVVLGSQNHHDVNQYFQPGYSYNGTASNISEATWLTYLLPYVEQEPLFLKANFNLNFGSPPNQNNLVLATVLPFNICPSNGAASDPALTYFGKGNYVGNNGIGPMLSTTTFKAKDSVQKLGIFMINSRTAIADVRDGTSFTALASEIIRVNGEDFRGVMHYPEGPLYQHNRTPNTRTPDDWRGALCVSTKNAPCVGTYTAYNNRAIILSARSFHPGGVHIGLCDGSVKLVADTVNLSVWQALGTAGDGEVIGTNF